MELSKFNSLQKDKGVAGLALILSVVVFLFIIGFLVMVFALMGDELDNALETSVAGPSTHTPNQTTYSGTFNAFTNATLLALENIQCTLQNFTNHSNGVLITSGNYTLGGTGGCSMNMTAAAVADTTLNGTGWNATYTFAYVVDTTASGVATNTTTAISGAVDWFDIVLVIGFMVVLILLVVLIITTLRGSGLVGGAGGTSGGTGGAGNVGSA